MAPHKGHPEDCGCCAGVDAETPRRITNLPGKPAISYRIGDYSRFRETMLAGLSDSRLPALASLGTREDTDFSIALCDALATSLDVLTFYQERIANEHYLRTATEARSIAFMANLIGYRPAPGVAASTYLAFTLQEAPGNPTRGAGPVTIPRGTAVQSVPGPGEEAQTFETVEDAPARVDWNAIPAQLTEAWRPGMGDTELFLEGVATRLQPGDAILIVGQEREGTPGSERWDVRVLTSVEADTENERTRVSWAEGLGAVSPFTEPAARGVRVFALRQRAALFGHNAPDPNLMNTGTGSNLQVLLAKESDGVTLKNPWEWASFELDSSQEFIDLDATYPNLVAGGWVALVSNEEGIGSPSLPGYVELYRADTVRQVSRSDFGLSAKVTRVGLDTTENLGRFARPETLVLTGSEELNVLPRILAHPVYGDRLALETLVEGLGADRPLAVRGTRQRISVGRGVTGLKILTDDDAEVQLQEGDSLFLLAAPERMKGSTPVALDPEAFGETLRDTHHRLRLRVLDRDGRTGLLHCRAHQIRLQASSEDDEEVAEIVLLASGPDSVQSDRDRTALRLATQLKHCYERSSVAVNANVAPATHGETVKEILGNGDAGRPDMAFQLRQAPLTYVSAATPSGRESTVELRVNDLLWSEVDTLYRKKTDDRVYAVRTDPEGNAIIRFGDGIEGARPASGQNNIRAVYRKNLGVSGNVPAEKLTNLLSRPQGVKEVTNPAAAEGGEDRESLAASRENAPLSVLTLGRTVSVQDYADFARGFAGISKAHAIWIPVGPGRGVFLTVAGIDGAPISATSATRQDLLAALRTFGDPLIPVHLVDYRPAVFRTGLALQVSEGRKPGQVLEGVRERLRRELGFGRRAFGQGVTEGEVMALAHGVEGVAAVRVTRLYRPGPGVTPTLKPRLFAGLPVASLTSEPEPAEILTLDPTQLELKEIQ